MCKYLPIKARKIRRSYEDSRNRLSLHEEFLNLLKELPEQAAHELIEQLRIGFNVSTIVKHVQDSDLLLQLQLVPETRFRYELPYSRDMPAILLRSGSPYLSSLVYGTASRRALDSQAQVSVCTEPNHLVLLEDHTSSRYRNEYLKPYHAAVLVEPRLQNVKPSEWTSVSKDDTLMRDLLTAYFTHEYHLWPFFQKDYFLEGMAKPVSDDERILCCSSLLVNAVLAYACVSIVPW